jgi:hypothetical protein
MVYPVVKAFILANNGSKAATAKNTRRRSA